MSDSICDVDKNIEIFSHLYKNEWSYLSSIVKFNIGNTAKTSASCLEKCNPTLLHVIFHLLQSPVHLCFGIGLRQEYKSHIVALIILQLFFVYYLSFRNDYEVLP